MTPRHQRQKGSVTVSALILAAAGIYLAFRSWVALQAALAPVPTPASAAGLAKVPIIEEAEARDQVLALVEPPARDPFHKIRRRPVFRRPVTPPPEELVPPRLRLVLYDQVSPEVQFTVDGAYSGRLKEGGSFRGWTVMSISARSCVVSKDGKTFTLSSRRPK